MVADMVTDMEVDMVSDMEVEKVADLEVDIMADIMADMVADLVADMEVNVVANMEVDMMADIAVGMVADMFFPHAVKSTHNKETICVVFTTQVSFFAHMCGKNIVVKTTQTRFVFVFPHVYAKNTHGLISP